MSLAPTTRRAAQWLQRATQVAILLVLGAGLAVSILPDALLSLAQQALAPPAEPTWEVSLLTRILLLFPAWISLAAVLFTLWQMALLFECYANDDPLSEEAARAVRAIGVGLLAQAAIHVLAHTFTGLILSIDAPAGERMLAIGVGSMEVGFALAGALLLLVGSVLVEASRALEENESFV